MKKIKNEVKKITPNGTVILFVSRARRIAAPDSDWDILILTEEVTPELEHEISVSLYEVELKEEIIINPLILSRKEWNYGLYYNHPMHRKVESQGVSL